jgi:2-hydroxy-6-oxonona-2,4-dienedioate hydrolase
MKAAWTRVDGKRVRYRVAGEGPTVVIVAGLGLNSTFYLPNLAGLAERGIRAIAPDLPGFGATSGKKTGLEVDEAVEWLVQFADTVGVHKAVWLGHSIGCQTALALAAAHPERALGLVLTGPTGARGSRLIPQLFAVISVAVRLRPRVLWAVARDYVRTTPWQYVGWWLRAARDQPLDQASRVRAPVLILLGSRDPVPAPEFLAELSARLPRSELQRVPGALHALPVEQPDEFNRRVAAFVHAVSRSDVAGTSHGL